ncbi:hypothetical protein FOA43_001429 [Brettanomyces nanus]|uniref:Trafficking protein particle complex III-specific subunit 85 n=1 Tax=Eeniella nana TaxID=13502 RepID=A0A875RU21_EENNA|nr:uncharacterized protein FOA43_001429 [Brettanomyces nanus]QPG74107.1 hypothetical protein FOA43_001429 [Brettanomyces nanus]
MNSLVDQDLGGSAINGSPSRLIVRFVQPLEDQVAGQRADSTKGVADLSISTSSSTSAVGFASSAPVFGLPELYDQSNNNIQLERFVDLVSSRIEDTQFFQNTIRHPTDSFKDEDSTDIEILQDSIYVTMLSKSLASNTVVPFEYINHPIVNVIATTSDEDLQIVQEKYFACKKSIATLPSWLDEPHTSMTLFLILVDSDKPEELQKGLHMQEQLKLNLGKKAVIAPVSFNKAKKADQAKFTLYRSQLGLEQQPGDDSVEIPKKVYDAFNIQLQDIIYKSMIPFMQREIKLWNEHTNDGDSYSPVKGYYSTGASEVIIRRLADWYFMLRDYKNSYTTYEMLKKDFLSDRAYSYLSSLQEFMVLSLMLGASSKVNPLENSASQRGKGITKKIVTDLALALVPSFPPEAYYAESQKLFKKLIDSKLVDDLCSGILMERLAYIYYCYDKPVFENSDPPKRQSYYEESNPFKLHRYKMAEFGLSKSRKSILWMLLACRKLDPTVKPTQVALMVWRIEKDLENFGFSSDRKDHYELVWPYREDSLLHELKQALEAVA